MPNLEIAVSELKKQYDKYKKRRQCFSPSESRSKRDREFEKILSEITEKKLLDEMDLEKICIYYKKHKNSGGFGTEPELIKYVRQALYSIFEVDHSKPKGYRACSFIQYNDPTPETDYSIKHLHRTIKRFEDYMQQIIHSEGISLVCM